MRAVLGDLAPDHLLDEHQALKEGLAHLSASNITDPNFDGNLQDIMEVRAAAAAAAVEGLR